MCSELWAYPRVQEHVRSAVPRPSHARGSRPIGNGSCYGVPSEVCWSTLVVGACDRVSPKLTPLWTVFFYLGREEKNKTFGRTLVANHNCFSVTMKPAWFHLWMWWPVVGSSIKKRGGGERENRPCFQVGSHLKKMGITNAGTLSKNQLVGSH